MSVAYLEAHANFIRLLPILFLFWLAVVVGRTAARRERSQRLLCGFLTLVALGFLLEFLAWLLDHAQFPSKALRGLAFLVGVIDAPVLLAFCLAFLQSRVLRNPLLWILYACLGGSLFLLLVVPWSQGVPASAFAGWAAIVYVNGTYLASFVLLLWAYVREEFKFRERRLFFVVVGVGFAGVSRTWAAFFTHLRPGPSTNPVMGFLLPGLAASLLILAAIASAFVVLDWRRAPHATRVFGWLAAMLTGFAAAYYLVILLDDALGLEAVLRLQYFALRWLVVGGVLGYGVLRYQLFDFELRTRQAVALLAAAVVGLTGAVTVGAQSEAVGFSSPSARLLALLSAFLVTPTVYYGILALWNWLRGGRDLPARYDRRRLELYEAALQFSLGKSPWTLPERLFADTLREVFQISSEEHDRVVASLRRPRGDAEKTGP